MKHNRSIQLVPDDIGSVDPVDAKFILSAAVDSLREWERLGGECAACRRHGLANQYQVKEDFAARPLAELQVFLHCTVCDNRDGNKFIISKIARD